MNIPTLTPQRQKMLIGAAAAGLLLVLGFSFAPDVELAETNLQDGDDAALLVDSDRDAAAAERLKKTRPFRRSRVSGSLPAAEAAAETNARPRSLPTDRLASAEPVTAREGQVVPPSYQQRLALLAEEEEALQQQRQRRLQAGDSASSAPLPTVTVASADSLDEDDVGVEQALAQARRPQRLRRVELINGASAATPADARGAWLSGSIEID